MILPVRIPMSVKRGKSRCGQRLIDRRPAPYPRIAFRHNGREIGKFAREIGIEKIGISRAGTVMEETGDHIYPALAKHGQPVVGPGKIELVGTVGGNGLPQDRITDRAQPRPAIRSMSSTRLR